MCVTAQREKSLNEPPPPQPPPRDAHRTALPTPSHSKHTTAPPIYLPTVYRAYFRAGSSRFSCGNFLGPALSFSLVRCYRLSPHLQRKRYARQVPLATIAAASAAAAVSAAVSLSRSGGDCFIGGSQLVFRCRLCLFRKTGTGAASILQEMARRTEGTIVQ